MNLRLRLYVDRKNPANSINMKRIFLAVMMIGVAASFAVAQTSNKKHGPVLTWASSTHDFGDITQGDKVEHTFEFTNTGTEPLVITNVEVTCGCTVPKGWTRDPILPGNKSEIVIAFNSSGKYGRQNKVVTVISNASNTDAAQITFSANVLEKKVSN
jgi:hypothetical protein